MRVTIYNVRTGAVKTVSTRDAGILVKLGKGWRYAGTVPRNPPPPDFDAMTYADLRRMVADGDVPVPGRKRDDMITGLRDHYRRRDMRAGG